ncbi:DUF2075 domain-containing protein [Pontibacter ramchanderi]|uniref:Uncharacterized protein DUF2075 n=1 Tax=Pontibacter ramchanderi TaxID=1179743 RepID=A0A2N3U8S0_9BACT|nr:DUF2075 domain-containing protein [Pontibacter ramchanderi]PKV63151.1 uncharacterized protein DUF2075 [Pontibacter ramchanderi]
MRSYYAGTLASFLTDESEKIFGLLSKNHGHALEDQQKNAWVFQIDHLKTCLNSCRSGNIFFEFAIPRMGKRVDNVLVIDGVIFVIEYKVGEKHYPKHALDQVTDYALDLKNFHAASHDKMIVPILVSTSAPSVENEIRHHDDHVFLPLKANSYTLPHVIDAVLANVAPQQFCVNDWQQAAYKPTPTIVEAAQALYRGHSVQEISRSDAGAENLSKTAACIADIIDRAKTNSLKAICFVTGVPGAGKTLAGLNIATERNKVAEEEHAVFLSGNGPLVDVLREALSRNRVEEAKGAGEKLSKIDAERNVKSFIQNIHHFRDAALVDNEKPPIEKVVVFDEAQRAWTAEQASSFMRRKKGVADFDKSEPEFLISVMDRHQDWCTIVCLIGGGQEINTGEAGLGAWFQALQQNFPDWEVYYSSHVLDKYEYTWSQNLLHELAAEKAFARDDLHLAVSVRSFRSERLSDFVRALIAGEEQEAASLYGAIQHNYPIVLTRDLAKAKRWLKGQARGSERYGLLASSGGYRLKPFGVHVKSKIEAPIWFLNDKEDVRASYFLEEVATEFDIQGLELDWSCVCWDGDFSYQNNQWVCRKFKGTKWQNVNSRLASIYLANAYRVLLTRARQGMVLFIPYGDSEDHSRQPAFYDGTYDLLKRIGIPELV